MANSHLTPHDRFFRAMMTDPKVIREFFEQNLPANIRAVINFDSIQHEKESFINDKLRLQIADMLYSVEFGDQLGYLYLLIEHQNTPTELMSFRILQYMVAIMNHHLTITDKNILPVIYPMIFYNGWKPYNYSTDIFDLFGDKKGLAQDILWKPCQLIDLSKISDEKLKNHLFYGVFAYVMKHIYEKDFLPVLKNILDDIKSIENQCGLDYISTILTYILEAGEIDKRHFVDTVKTSLSTIDEEKIMTLAEQFRQEGYQKGKAEGFTVAEQFRQDGLQEGLQKGLQEGLQEGLQKGMQEGKAEAFSTVAMRLLSQGLDIEQIATATGLTPEKIKLLKNNPSH